MPALHKPVFVTQHGVAVECAFLHEIGEKLAIAPLFMHPAGLDGSRLRRSVQRSGARPAQGCVRGVRAGFQRARTRTALLRLLRSAPGPHRWRARRDPGRTGRRRSTPPLLLARGVRGTLCRIAQAASCCRRTPGRIRAEGQIDSLRHRDRRGRTVARRRSRSLLAPSKQACAAQGCRPNCARFCRLMRTGPKRGCAAMWWSIYCEAKASLPVTKLRSPSPRSCTKIASQDSAASPGVLHIERARPRDFALGAAKG